MNVGAVIPPSGYIRRERPSTPSAHMALTRPVVPPDGSFIFGRDFLNKLRGIRVVRTGGGRPVTGAGVTREISGAHSQRGHSAVWLGRITPYLC